MLLERTAFRHALSIKMLIYAVIENFQGMETGQATPYDV